MAESAGTKKGKNATGHGNRYLARVLGEAAVAACKTDRRYQVVEATADARLVLGP